MAELTKESSIQELVKELRRAGTGPIRNALWSDYPEGFVGDRTKGAGNQKWLAERKIRSVGDLLTPEGEMTLYCLQGVGSKSMMALQPFLAERGLSPDWPMTDRTRQHYREKASHIRTGRGAGLSLERALEEADKQYAMKTGEPVGDFSRKLAENTRAQQEGARLKGRRTL
jgi:hypothetical protein